MQRTVYGDRESTCLRCPECSIKGKELRKSRELWVGNCKVKAEFSHSKPHVFALHGTLNNNEIIFKQGV